MLHRQLTNWKQHTGESVPHKPSIHTTTIRALGLFQLPSGYRPLPMVRPPARYIRIYKTQAAPMLWWLSMMTHISKSYPWPFPTSHGPTSLPDSTHPHLSACDIPECRSSSGSGSQILSTCPTTVQMTAWRPEPVTSWRHPPLRKGWPGYHQRPRLTFLPEEMPGLGRDVCRTAHKTRIRKKLRASIFQGQEILLPRFGPPNLHESRRFIRSQGLFDARKPTLRSFVACLRAA